jgi:hypothetical protein
LSQIEKKDEKTIKENKEFAYDILTIAKKMHISFEELSILRIKDLFKFADSYMDKSTDKNKKKKASQEDIDKFYK